MFLYGGVMGIVAIIFAIMSYFYVYVIPVDSHDPEEEDQKETLQDMNGIPMEERTQDSKIWVTAVTFCVDDWLSELLLKKGL